MSKVPWNNKLPISQEKVEWFCWFFACSYFDLNRYPLRYKNMLFWAGIVRHRLSANQKVRFCKLKKLENYVRCQFDFLLPEKLQKIQCYFGLWLQNTIGQSFCRIFYFNLFDLLILLHWCIVLVYSSNWLFLSIFLSVSLNDSFIDFSVFHC